MQQHPALEVLAAGEQPVRVPLHAEDLALDPVEQLRSEHHVLARDPGAVEEVQQDPTAVAEHLAAEGDHLPAEHVALDGELADLGDDLLGVRGVTRGHLEADLGERVGVLRGAQQHRQPRVAVADQVDAALDAGVGAAAGPGGHGGRGDVPPAELGPVPARLHQVGQPERVMVEPRDADQLVLPAGLGQPGVETHLQVHVVVLQPGSADDRHAARAGAEMLVQLAAQRMVFPAGRTHRPADQAAAQPAHVGQLGPHRLVRRRPA